MYEDINQRYLAYLASQRTRHDGEIRPVAGKSTIKLMKQAFTEGSDPSDVVALAYKKDRLWMWSDMHFNHVNIQEYANRPVEPLPDMEARMLANYQKNIGDNDVVIFGGDVSMGHASQIEDCFQKISQLPGIKVLIRGNHDKSTMTQLSTVFDYVCSAFCFETEQGVNDCAHYPLPAIPGRRVLHGHTHQYRISPKHINMSVELTDYAPVKLRELASKQNAWFD